MTCIPRYLHPIACASLFLALTGCSLSPTAAPTAQSGPSIRGRVHGGSQPIIGSQIYLYAANTTGYGYNGLALNASISLLNSNVLTNSPGASGIDRNGNYYVTSDSDGNFNITGDYACAPGQQVYVYASGGDAGNGSNTAIGLMAILGSCPGSDNFLGTVPFLTINEATTVAAAYAMAGFASTSTAVSSSGTPLAQVGIANAFANAGNLVYLPTGSANVVTLGTGNGTVPQAEIDTLADILAACVNTSGAGSPQCTTLFAAAPGNGTFGVSDTATAAINIAHYPGTNVSTLFNLVGSIALPFQPILATAPNDWTIAITYPTYYSPAAVAIDAAGDAWYPTSDGSLGEFSSTGAPLAYGYTGGGLGGYTSSIAIDNSGNIWIPNYNGTYSGLGPGTLSEFASDGTPLSPSTGYTGGGLNYSHSLAIDGSSNVWVANELGSGTYGYPSLSEFSNTGTAITSDSGYYGGVYEPYATAIDGAGNIWTADSCCGPSEVSNAGTNLSPQFGYSGASGNGAEGIAVDASGNVWLSDSSNNTLSKFSNSGTALSPSAGYTGGGLSTPGPVAIDGAGNVWIANQQYNGSTTTGGTVSEFSSSGTALSPANGYMIYVSSTITAYMTSIAIDGSGDVWSTIQNGATLTAVTELIGAATPVITPLCAGLPATPTTDGSSNLGTEP